MLGVLQAPAAPMPSVLKGEQSSPNRAAQGWVSVLLLPLPMVGILQEGESWFYYPSGMGEDPPACSSP